MRAVTLESLIEPLGLVDFLDMDIQGVEAEVLESDPLGLARKVRMVHVATHSGENERRLRELFGRLDWQRLNDYECGSTAETPWGTIHFQDGVQTWGRPPTRRRRALTRTHGLNSAWVQSLLDILFNDHVLSEHQDVFA